MHQHHDMSHKFNQRTMNQVIDSQVKILLKEQNKSKQHIATPSHMKTKHLKKKTELIVMNLK